MADPDSPEPQDFDARDIWPPEPERLAAFKLRGIAERLQFRIDAMREKDLEGVSISLGFASEIATTARAAATMLEPPLPGPDASKPVDDEPVF